MWLYLLHPTSYHNSHTRLLYGCDEFKAIKGNLSCHDPVYSGNERKRDSVGGERSYMQIDSNSEKKKTFESSVS